MLKVSVVIPVYNSEKFLRKCFDSLLNQTLKNIEIIVVNDGSTDQSQKIIDEYIERHTEIFKVRIVDNGGQGRARNIGVKMTTGEYISFVDSDDYVAPTMLQEMYEMAKFKDADIVTCNYNYVDENGREKLVVPKVAANQKDMFIDPDVSPCNKIYRGSILRDSGVRFPEGYFYEDTAYYFMLIPYVKKLASVQKPFYYYVLHGDSSVHGVQGKRVTNIFPIMDEMVSYYKEIGQYERYYSEIEYAYVKILLCSSMGRICQVKDRAFKRAAMEKTLKKLNNQFPDYRSNIYLKHGVKAFYMRHIQLWNIGICAFLMSMFNIHQK